MGSLGFGESSERVMQSDFHRFIGPKPIRSSGHHSNLVVETLDRTAGNLCFGTEPFQNRLNLSLNSCSPWEKREIRPRDFQAQGKVPPLDFSASAFFDSSCAHKFCYRARSSSSSAAVVHKVSKPFWMAR